MQSSDDEIAKMKEDIKLLSNDFLAAMAGVQSALDKINAVETRVSKLEERVNKLEKPVRASLADRA